MIRILHLADLHLGASFTRFAVKGKELREGIKRTLINIVKVAQDERADIMVIAGDLSDSNKLSPGALDFIISQLEKLDMPVVIMPGTHDCFNASSLYRRQAWAKLKNIQIFSSEQNQTFEFHTLSLAVHGKANTSNRDIVSPLNGIVPSLDCQWNIAVAHGSVQIPGKSAEDDYPITFEEIANSRMNYIALGHWHNYGEFKQGNTVACYAGSASTLGFNEGDSGTISLVELTDGSVTIRRIPVANYQWKTVNCNIDELENVLKKYAASNSLLYVQLIQPTEKVSNIENLLFQYQEKYFQLKIDYEQVNSSPLDIDFAQYPEITFIGQFLKQTKDKIALTKDSNEKELLNKALEEGFRILTTGEVL